MKESEITETNTPLVWAVTFWNRRAFGRVADALRYGASNANETQGSLIPPSLAWSAQEPCLTWHGC